MAIFKYVYYQVLEQNEISRKLEELCWNNKIIFIVKNVR